MSGWIGVKPGAPNPDLPHVHITARGYEVWDGDDYITTMPTEKSALAYTRLIWAARHERGEK